MSSSFRIPPSVSSDEVDLLAVFQALWLQKKLIGQVVVFVALLATAYAFWVTPEYQVSSVLRPAAINELDALNRSEVYKLPPVDALIKVGTSLESYDTRLGFFRANQKLFKEFERPGRTLEQSFEEFNRNSISLVLPDLKKQDPISTFIKLELNYPSGVDGVAILNGFIEYAIEIERQKIAADLDVIVKNRLNELKVRLESARSNYDNDKEAKVAYLSESDALRRAQLQDELKALRAQLKTQRSDRVAQLTEAIGIARSLGIKKPSTPSALGELDRAGSSNVIRTEINNQQIPLYFMGTDALEAERSILQQRKSDDFTADRIGQIAKELQLLESNREIEVLNNRKNEDLFLSGVEPLRAEVARLRNLNINMNSFKLVTIDRQALEPLRPIKPKRSLIILGGVVVGMLMGVAVALLHQMIIRRREVR